MLLLLLLLRAAAILFTLRRTFAYDKIAYNFYRSECFASEFADSSNIPLTGKLSRLGTVQSCLHSNGVGNQVPIVSKRNISSLQKSISDGSYTVELWLRPQVSGDNNLIFSIGSRTGQSIGGCSNHIELSQSSLDFINGNATVSYSMSACSKGVSTGYILSSPIIFVDLPTPQVVHVVVVISFVSYLSPRTGTMIHGIISNFTVNGQYDSKNAYRAFISSSSSYSADASWSAADYLQLMPPSAYNNEGYPTPNAKVWSGSLYYFAMHTKVTVQENGEVGDHSDDPAFYQRAAIPSHELAMIALSAVDADDDPGSPNYGPTQTGPTMRLYITHLPAAGTGILYHLDGTPLSAPVTGTPGVQVPYDANSRSYAVRFRPPLDQYSIGGAVLSRFTFHAIDGVTGLPSAENATVSIVVTHVDKPPVPDTGQSTRHTAEQAHVISLRGTDVDSVMVAARIVTLPVHGRLYRVHPNGTASGQQITEAGTLVTGPYPVKVAYIYTGLQLVPPSNRSDPLVGADSLRFKLVDAEGRESLPGTYNFTATTAISATPSLALISDFPNAVEGRPSVTPMHGFDVADTPRALQMRLLRAPTRGRLVAGWDGGATIPVGGTIGTVVTDYKMGTAAYYLSDPHYFTHPRVSWNGTALNTPLDSFDFLAYATDGTGATVAESIFRTQYVAVKNVNDPSELRFNPAEKGGYSLEDGAYKIHAFGSAGPQHPSKATFSGFSIVDPDRGVDLITVSVHTSRGGLLSLNSKMNKLVDFNTQTYCYGNANWRCVGDGLSEPAMTFIGTPWAVQSALNGMTYESLNPNLVDTVNVTINDGEGGACLTNLQHGMSSLRSGCYSESVLITVNVIDFADVTGSNDMNSARNKALARQLMFVGIGLLATLVLAVSRCMYLRVTKEPKKGQWCVWMTDCKRKPAVKEGRVPIEEFNRMAKTGEERIRALTEKIKALEKESMEQKRLNEFDSQHDNLHITANGVNYEYNTEGRNTTMVSPADIEKGPRYYSPAAAANPTAVYSTPPGRRWSVSTATDSAGQIDDHYPGGDDYLQCGVMSDHLHSPPAGSRSLFSHPAAHEYGPPPVERTHYHMGGSPQRPGQYERPFVPPSPQSQYSSPQREHPQHNMSSPAVSTVPTVSITSPHRPGREPTIPQDPRKHHSPTRATPPRPPVDQGDRAHGGQSSSSSSSKSTGSSGNGGWSVHKHKSGKTFYYNTKTHQSTWSRPEGFVDRQTLQTPQSQPTPSRGTATSAMETVCM